MIYVIKKPENVSLIYNELKKFCRKSGVPYNVKQLAHFVRQNIHLPAFRVISSKIDDKVRGFAAFYILNDLIQLEEQKLFVAQFYSEHKDAKKEMSDYIVSFARDNYISCIEYVTYRDTDFMIEKFKEVDKPFKVSAHILTMEVE